MAEITKDVDTDVDLAYEALEQFSKIMALRNNGTTSRMVDFFRFCADAEQSVETNTTSDYFIPIQAQQEDSTAILLESTVLPSTDDMNLGKSISMSFTPPLAPEVLTKSNNIFIDGPETTIETIGIDSTKEMSTSIDTLNGSLEQSKLFPWLERISVDQCNESNKYIDKLALTFTANIRKDQKFFITLQEYYWIDKTKYRECFDLIDQGKKILDSFLDVKELIQELLVSGFQEGLVIMEKLMDHHRDFHISDSNEDFDSRLERACSWREEFAEKVRQDAEMKKSSIVKLQDEVLEAEVLIRIWHYKLMEVMYVNMISTEDLVRYLSESITKQEFAEQWLFPENVNRKRKFLEGITDLENKRQHYDYVVKSIQTLMINSYFFLRGRLAIINDSSVHDLELVKKGLTVKHIRDHVTESSIIWTITLFFAEVLREGPMKVYDTNVMKPLKDIREGLEAFEMNLREYQESIKMDSQFYL